MLENDIIGTWFDEASDETWTFDADNTFVHEWHIEADTRDGTYELHGDTLILRYTEGWEITWKQVRVTGNTLTGYRESDDFTLMRREAGG